MKTFRVHYTATVDGYLDVETDSQRDAEEQALSDVPARLKETEAHERTVMLITGSYDIALRTVTVRCPKCNKQYKQVVVPAIRSSLVPHVDDSAWECSDCILDEARKAH